MILLDGKKISNEIKDEIAAEVAQMKERGEKVPHLAAVLVGNDGASLTYVGSKVRSCKRIGFESTLKHLPEETTEEELLQLVLPEEIAKYTTVDQQQRRPLPSNYTILQLLKSYTEYHQWMSAAAKDGSSQNMVLPPEDNASNLIWGPIVDIDALPNTDVADYPNDFDGESMKW